MNSKDFKKRLISETDSLLPNVLERVKAQNPVPAQAPEKEARRPLYGTRLFRAAYALVLAAIVLAGVFVYSGPNNTAAAAVTFDFGDKYSLEFLLDEELEITTVVPISSGARLVAASVSNQEGLTVSGAITKLLSACAYQDYNDNNGSLLNEELSDGVLLLSIATDSTELKNKLIAELEPVEKSLKSLNVVSKYLGVLKVSAATRFLAKEHNISAGKYELIIRLTKSAPAVEQYKDLSPGKLIRLLEESEKKENEGN